MEKIILIACSAGKKEEPCSAKKLYISPLFKKSWLYAILLKPNKIFILSDKYYLLDPKKTISPYDKSLKNCKSRERKDWAKTVLENLKLKIKYSSEAKKTLDDYEFIILAGKVHYEHLIGKDGIQNYSIPWKGVGGIGCILKFLNEQIAQLCENHK